MKSTCEYYGWKYVDKGENHHPTSTRWQAVCQGVELQRGGELALRAAIDARRVRYPDSNGVG